MAIRGQRFHIDLSSDEDEDEVQRDRGTSIPSATTKFGLIGDIKERPLSATPNAPMAPSNRSSATGFPAHKKRSRISAFKQQRGPPVSNSSTEKEEQDAPTTIFSPTTLHDEALQADSRARPNSSHASAVDDMERQSIDEENKQRLAQMSDDEIERERQELMAGLSPSLIERLLKKTNLNNNGEEVRPESTEQKQGGCERSLTEKHVSFHSSIVPAANSSNGLDLQPSGTDAASISPPADLHPASSPSNGRSTALPPPPAIHFPQPAAPPDLDPSDPSFFSNLHQKYFPTLTADPSKLAWMAPIPSENSAADQDSPYFPRQESLPASSIRFDFRGDLLPPRTARQIPVTKGLHHHGEAAEAAGYTIPELARLARSRFPAQRSVAFQTLGRILYKLGKGLFGDEGSDLVMGLWRCVEEGKVLETVQVEANADGGHLSTKAYAMEAVWLWQKGGGRRWKAS